MAALAADGDLADREALAPRLLFPVSLFLDFLQLPDEDWLQTATFIRALERGKG